MVTLGAGLVLSGCPTGPSGPASGAQCEDAAREAQLGIGTIGTFGSSTPVYPRIGGGSRVIVEFIPPPHFDGPCASVRVTRLGVGTEVLYDAFLVDEGTSWVLPIDLPEPPERLVETGLELLAEVEMGGLYRSSLLGFSFVEADPASEPAAVATACPAPAQQSVEWGELVDDVFMPYGQARQPQLVFGFQGNTMITPRVAITWPDGPDELCVYLKTQNADEVDGFDAGGDRGSFVLTRYGDQLVSGLLFHIVDPDAARRQLRFIYRVSGAEVRAEGELLLSVD